MEVIYSSKFFALLVTCFLNVIDSGFSILCYKCHSIIHGDQCISLEKIDAIQRSKYVMDCRREHDYGNVNITMCRKVEQVVGDELRVIRSCAFRGSNRCIRRTGTSKKVKVTYCECNQDKCNKGHNSSPSYFLLLSIFIFIL